MELETENRTPCLVTLIIAIVVVIGLFAAGWFFLYGNGASVGTSEEQSITIIEPRTGSTVSNPFQVRGTTARPPEPGVLNYRVLDANNSLLGSGTIPVSADGETGPYSFTALVDFTPPADGETMALELYEQATDNEEVDAQSMIDLTYSSQAVSPEMQQTITIETPAPGTTVGSPVVITGRTSRYPLEGNLSYQILDAGGAELGSGQFPVEGTIDQPATFNASLTFNLPPAGGLITARIFERNPSSGNAIAESSLPLIVAPQPDAQNQQGITIETPAPGTTVGSPVVITGRVSRFPAEGNLSYRIVDANGNELGAGQFPVQGAPDQPATFNASLDFNPPPGGGSITAVIFERDPTSGALAGQASIPLNLPAP